MYKKRVIISIVVVHYNVKRELFACLTSILESRLKIPYEIIIVDNEEKSAIGVDLKKNFSRVVYIKNKKNVGFGKANNIGAKKASGDFLFFLNPDTLIDKDTLGTLLDFIERDKNIAIVAPIILDESGNVSNLQGSTELTPIEGIVCHSFMNKYFPNNLISRRYFLRGWDKKTPKEADVISGAAFLVRKFIFDKSGGFDENIMLYFEEVDICRRIKSLGCKIFIEPKAKIVHLGQRSVIDKAANKKIFSQSRFYYFKKHFGLFWAVIVHIIASIGNPLKR